LSVAVERETTHTLGDVLSERAVITCVTSVAGRHGTVTGHVANGSESGEAAVRRKAMANGDQPDERQLDRNAYFRATTSLSGATVTLESRQTSSMKQRSSSAMIDEVP